ncbi:MAG: AAA family ATPase [Caldilineaceae bacterium]
MKLPYGVRDFDKLIREGYLYIDRTDRIPLLENLGSDLLFLRPRRFGKSLWLSTLINYYDVAKAHDFDRLFGQLAIGQNPTPLHNQYLVMKWDFSNIPAHGSSEQMEKALHEHINQWLQIFVDDYRALFPALRAEVTIHPANALTSFHSVVAAVRRNGHKLYLFIDEYDNFANEVMMGQQGDNQQRYQDLVKGEGLFKTIFKNIKSAGAGEGLDRVFITGVSPIVMNDVTSGNNVTQNVTWRPYLNDLCGFRQEEVQPLVNAIITACGLPLAKADEAMEMMRRFYNGSRFVLRDVENTPKIYNPTLAFYFLGELQEFCRYPDNMLDSNLAPDYYKLVYISNHPAGRELLLDAVTEGTTLSVAEVGDRFGITEMLQPTKQRERLAALLYYLGALTIAGQTADAQTILEIPNLVMRKLYAERILELTFPEPATRDEAQAVTRQLFAQGALAPLCHFVETHYFPIYDNRDYKDFNELTLKTIFLALLHYNNLYIMDSEPALQRTYADLIMLIRPEMRHFSVYDLLLEFKYVPLAKLDKDRESKKKLTGTEVRQLPEKTLRGLDAVKEQFTSARQQLQGYRQTLQQKYGAILKLRTYAVVSVGVDRLLWEEVKD